MNKINQGGAAFPHEELHDEYPRPGAVECRHLHAETGMTLRDYFAAHADVDADVGVKYAESILGRKMPDYSIDPVGNSIFWADARACLRYIEADAMIRARGEA